MTSRDAITVLLWLMALVIIVVGVGVTAYRSYVSERCRRAGHPWRADPDGFICSRCGATRRVGDWM